MRTSTPWLTRLTGVAPPFTAISRCYRYLPPPLTTERKVRSNPTSLSPPWAPTGVAAPPRGPVAARTAPKVADAARGHSTAAAPPSRSQDRHRWPSRLVYFATLSSTASRPTVRLLLVGKLSFLGDVNAVCLGHLVFLEDHTTAAIFLTDTCASVSLVPGPASPQGLLLTATNGGHHHWS